MQVLPFACAEKIAPGRGREDKKIRGPTSLCRVRRAHRRGERMADTGKTHILTLSCEDRVGIVAAVSGHLASIDGFILDSQQYADLDAGRFFMRVEFKGDGARFPEQLQDLQMGFAPTAERFGLEWELVSSGDRPRLLIAVSKASHCLNDLLHPGSATRNSLPHAPTRPHQPRQDAPR